MILQRSFDLSPAQLAAENKQSIEKYRFLLRFLGNPRELLPPLEDKYNGNKEKESKEKKDSLIVVIHKVHKNEKRNCMVCFPKGLVMKKIRIEI